MPMFRFCRVSYHGGRPAPVEAYCASEREALVLAQEIRTESCSVEIWLGPRLIRSVRPA